MSLLNSFVNSNGSPRNMNVTHGSQIILTNEFILNNKILNVPYIVNKINKNIDNEPISINISYSKNEKEYELKNIDIDYPNMIQIVSRKI